MYIDSKYKREPGAPPLSFKQKSWEGLYALVSNIKRTANY